MYHGKLFSILNAQQKTIIFPKQTSKFFGSSKIQVNLDRFDRPSIVCHVEISTSFLIKFSHVFSTLFFCERGQRPYGKVNQSLQDHRSLDNKKLIRCKSLGKFYVVFLLHSPTVCREQISQLPLDL
jgi:hypothetical protein